MYPQRVMIPVGSVGDILTLVHLAFTIAEALQDATGSPAEYQELKSELDSFSLTLAALEKLLSVPCCFDSNAMQGINSAISRSVSLMERFREQFEGYHNHLQPGGSGNRPRDFWRKVSWSIRRSRHAKQMRIKLLEEKLTINNLISISNCTALARIEASVIEQQTVLFSLSQTVKQLPRALGYHWEGAQSAKFKLLDALGNSLDLPIELCHSWDDFDRVLKIYFSQRAGRRFVERGDYELTTGLEGTEIISPATWESRVKPNVIISMSIILRIDSPDATRNCPRCGRECSSKFSAGAISCPFCQALFRVSGHQPTAVIPSNPQSETPKPAEDEEIRYLRRFHIISLPKSKPLKRRQSETIYKLPPGHSWMVDSEIRHWSRSIDITQPPTRRVRPIPAASTDWLGPKFVLAGQKAPPKQ